MLIRKAKNYKKRILKKINNIKKVPILAIIRKAI